MNWKPIKHKVVREEGLQNVLHDRGYAVHGNIGADNVLRLRELYASLHAFSPSQGGMFYSLYSDNIDYRQQVHKGIDEILSGVYDPLFTDYKSVLNSFIVKTPGPGSDFSLHQDSTGLNEFENSPLSLWIPLQDTTLENGTLCVVPKTHSFFHPLRGISFKSPFADYEDVMRTYLLPIDLKAGDILMFDNRLVHYSHTNTGTAERIVVMSGIFPAEADIISVYKDESVAGAPYEIYKQSADFLITNTAFYKDCTARPYRGEIIQTINTELPARTVSDFTTWAKNNGVEQLSIECLTKPLNTMHIISEPVAQNT